MTKELLEKFIGFPTFFECVKWLYREGLDKKVSVRGTTRESEKIIFGQKVPVPSETMQFSIPELKSKALEEIIKALPSKEDQEKILQSISEQIPGYKRDEVFQIIYKIPTK